jgi:hypothetical protein
MAAMQLSEDPGAQEQQHKPQSSDDEEPVKEHRNPLTSARSILEGLLISDDAPLPRQISAQSACAI